MQKEAPPCATISGERKCLTATPHTPALISFLLFLSSCLHIPTLCLLLQSISTNANSRVHDSLEYSTCSRALRMHNGCLYNGGKTRGPKTLTFPNLYVIQIELWMHLIWIIDTERHVRKNMECLNNSRLNFKSRMKLKIFAAVSYELKTI